MYVCNRVRKVTPPHNTQAASALPWLTRALELHKDHPGVWSAAIIAMLNVKGDAPAAAVCATARTHFQAGSHAQKLLYAARCVWVVCLSYVACFDCVPVSCCACLLLPSSLPLQSCVFGRFAGEAAR